MIHINTNDIDRFINEGESEKVEFKQKTPSDSIIFRILSAFANTNGGILIIGVSEEGEVIGIPDNELNQIIDRLNKIVTPMLPLTYNISSLDYQNKKIAFAAIETSPFYVKPIYTSQGDIFVRTHDNPVPSTNFYPDDARRKILSIQSGKDVGVFVAMSFRNEEEPHLEDYYRAMERAAIETELPIKLCRMDMIEGDFEISQEIMVKIDDADIVLADFTLNSRNVYFEVGYGRGRGKQIIQSARIGAKLEFDIRNWKTSFYRNATELEKKLIPELKLAYSNIVNE